MSDKKSLELDADMVQEKMSLLNITQQQLATHLKVTQQAVGNWFTRKKIPISHSVAIDSLLGLNHFKNMASNNHLSDDSMVSVRKIANIMVSAGTGYAMDDIHEYSDGGLLEISEFSIPNHYAMDNLRAIKVDGKSMLPTLMPDEYVLIDISQKQYTGDGLYVVNYGGNLIVKRLQFVPENGGTVEIISDNPQFKSYKLIMNDDQTSLYIIGKVVMQLTR